MGKTSKILSIILSLLMATQTTVIAGEIAVDETPLMEETATEDILIEEELPEEIVVEENAPDEVIPEVEELEEELIEDEFVEDSFVSVEENLEEELVEEPIDVITDEVPADQINAVSTEDSLVEIYEPDLVGETSGQCGANVYWTYDYDDDVLTISGSGDMYDYGWGPTPWTQFYNTINSIIIESGVTSIGDYAFWSLGLDTVSIPNSVTSIGFRAFFNSSLKIVNIPDSVTSIGDCAFQWCDLLTSVTIGSGVRSVEAGAFLGCAHLKEINVSASNSAFCSSEGVLFNKDQTSIIRFPPTRSGAYTIPASVTSIGDYAFRDCVSLKSVTIPEGVTSIGRDAFENCDALNNIKIPDSVTSIGCLAFTECSSLTNVTIGRGVTSIDYRAFENCNRLKTIIFEGDAPLFICDPYFKTWAFFGVIATAYYPADNPTWTEDVRQDYSGNITWVPTGRKLFSDVTDPTAFFYDPIYWAVDNNITTGFPADNTFRPNNNCNRAAVVTFLWRLAGRPTPSTKATFTDMTDNPDFDTAISWAAEEGITTGYDDGTFRPWNTCNRAAIVTFIWRYAGRPEPSSMASFSDMTKNNDFDRAISWAAENNITTGYTDGTFRPWNQCLRLAVVSFLYRYAHL